MKFCALAIRVWSTVTKCCSSMTTLQHTVPKWPRPKSKNWTASKFFHIQRIALTLRHLIMVCFAQWPTSSADGASTTLMPSKRAVKSFLPRNPRIGIIAKFEYLRKDGWLLSIIMEFISKNKLLSFLFYPSLNKSWILSENFRDNLVFAWPHAQATL